jgi:hypothetical protein
LRFVGGVDARSPIGTEHLTAAARVTARLGREAQRVEIDDMDVRAGASSLTGQARFDTDATPQLAAELRADRIDVGALDGAKAIALAPLLAVRSGDLRLRVGQLAWRDMAAQGVVIHLMQRDRDFELRELAARDIAGASLHAAGRFVRATDGTFAFNALDFRYGRLEGRGRLALDFTASPIRLQADIRTGPLLLDSVVPAPPLLPPEPMTRRAAAAAAREAPLARRGWSGDPLPWPLLPPITAELHLSAPSIGWRGLQLDVATFDGRLADGALTIEQLSGLIYGGRVEIRGRAPAIGEAAPGFAGTLRLTDVDLRSVLKAYAGVSEIAGRLDGIGDLRVVGQSPAELVASLAGSVQFEIHQGVVNGFDLPGMSARLKHMQRPTDLFEVVRLGLGPGRTPFRSLAGTFHVERGVARTTDLRLLAAAGEGRTRGTIDLPAWSLDLINEFRLTEHPDLLPLTLKVSGPIEAPRRVFDIERLQSSLVRRGRTTTR